MGAAGAAVALQPPLRIHRPRRAALLDVAEQAALDVAEQAAEVGERGGGEHVRRCMVFLAGR